MRKNLENFLNDLLQLSGSLKDKFTKSDFGKTLKHYPDSAELKILGLNRIRIKFEKYNKVDTVTTNW